MFEASLGSVYSTLIPHSFGKRLRLKKKNKNGTLERYVCITVPSKCPRPGGWRGGVTDGQGDPSLGKDLGFGLCKLEVVGRLQAERDPV
jgi:hypothetical protein